jgi:hypothetical protein
MASLSISHLAVLCSISSPRDVLARQLKAKLQCTIRKADASTCNPQQVKSRTKHRVITDALFSHLRRLETKNETRSGRRRWSPPCFATGALNYNLAEPGDKAVFGVSHRNFVSTGKKLLKALFRLPSLSRYKRQIIDTFFSVLPLFCVGTGYSNPFLSWPRLSTVLYCESSYLITGLDVHIRAFDGT